MADAVAQFLVRLLGAAIEALFDLLLVLTGRKVLSIFRRQKSNAVVEILIGLLVWALVGILLFAALR
jgi:hypothetical protein